MTILRWIVCCLTFGIANPCRAQEPPPTHSPVPTPAVGHESSLGPALGAPPRQELVSILKNREATAQPWDTRDAPEWFQTMMQRIVRENIPEKYVVDKDWGQTDKRWDGLKVRRDGLQIRTKRRWKEVNHGTWRRYEVTQLDPSTNLLLRIENVRDQGEGNVGFEVSLTSKLRAFGRQSQWTKGVQLYSISAAAGADVQMRLWCQMGLRLDLQKLPPDVLLVPTVTQAELHVTDFRLDSVSKLDGPLVKQLGHGIEKILREKIAEKEATLPAKINGQIAKNEDKMRFSISDFAASKWKAITSGATVSRPASGPAEVRDQEYQVMELSR